MAIGMIATGAIFISVTGVKTWDEVTVPPQHLLDGDVGRNDCVLHRGSLFELPERAMLAYRQDMQRAWDRINSVAAGKLQTRFGTIQYAEKGKGLALLVGHGVLGCHVDGVDGWWSNLWGPGFRIIAPARFGYFDSTLPPAATPADH